MRLGENGQQGFYAAGIQCVTIVRAAPSRPHSAPWAEQILKRQNPWAGAKRGGRGEQEDNDSPHWDSAIQSALSQAEEALGVMI